jgi:hypothetical protein
MKRKYVGLGIGIGLGICFGAAVGTVMHNVAVGIALGVSLGTVASSRFVFGGRSDEALARQKAVGDKPLPRPLGL